METTIDTEIWNANLLKAIANILGTLSLNLNINISIITWFILQPLAWYELGWSTAANIEFHIANMVLHSIPLLTTLVQVFLLQDVPLYFSDSWILAIFPTIYLFYNYGLYHYTGKVLYPTYMNWKDPSSYWQPIVTTISQSVILVILNGLLSIATQFLVGRNEWTSSWL